MVNKMLLHKVLINGFHFSRINLGPSHMAMTAALFFIKDYGARLVIQSKLFSTCSMASSKTDVETFSLSGKRRLNPAQLLLISLMLPYLRLWQVDLSWMEYVKRPTTLRVLICIKN